jgi:hypothetical protein
LLDEDESTQIQNDSLENNDDAMDVDNDGGSNSNQQRSRRSENTISYEEFSKIRDKIISKLKVKCRLILFNIFMIFNFILTFYLILIKSACSEDDLTQWYLEEHENTFESEESIQAEETKFKKVVKLLIKVMLLLSNLTINIDREFELLTFKLFINLL